MHMHALIQPAAVVLKQHLHGPLQTRFFKQNRILGQAFIFKHTFIAFGYVMYSCATMSSSIHLLAFIENAFH